MLEVGSVLDGKYRILSEIGRGGMSVVYLAINERANKTWAVKEVRKGGESDQAWSSRGLAAETEMLKKLSHPNLPCIVDVIDQEDSFLIVMDYIEGRSLQDLLDHAGPQDPDRVTAWAVQLCDVLGYLHSRRPPIIYRDMKPANIMLRPDGSVSLIDFGTAREYKDTGREDTVWLGTRGYAAPEQFGGRGQTDGRTDIFNLGATMYHLVTGYSPADTNFVIHPIGEIVPELGGTGLEKIILKCCRPEASDRYQTCAELMYALEHIHDEDEKAVRARKVRWNIFAAALAVAAFAAAGGIFFRGMYERSAGAQYALYLTEAENKKTLEERLLACEPAVRLVPQKAEAWERILRDLQDRDHEKLTAGETAAIDICVKSRERERKASNLEVLRSADKRLYARVNYDLGMILYFSSDNGKNTAFTYLQAAVEEEKGLGDREAAVARMMFRLAEADRRKNEAVQDRYSDGEGYRAYWNMLTGMVDGRVTTLEDLYDECGQNAGYPLAVCNEVARALCRDSVDLKSGGVREGEMRSALAAVECYMDRQFPEGTRLNENMQKRVSEVRRLIEKAKTGVRRTFD